MLVLIHIFVIHIVSLSLVVEINLCITKLFLFPTVPWWQPNPNRGRGMGEVRGVASTSTQAHMLAQGSHEDGRTTTQNLLSREEILHC